MHAIVEVEGVLFDVKAACWTAYGKAVADIGWARTDEMTCWRLIRSGADDAEFVRGARPHQVEAFRQAFDKHIDSDEVVSEYAAHDDLQTRVRVLRELGRCHAVTAGANSVARFKLLQVNALGDMFPQLTTVPAPAMVGAGQLRELAVEGDLAVVFAATEQMARAADAADLVCIGITSGPCIAKRLAGAGARATYRDLAEFQSALRSGDEQLRRAGLCM